LVLAVVPCCPFVSLAGGLLGVMVLWRMNQRGAGPSARGRRVALAAAVSGLLVSLETTAAYSWWQNRMEASMRREAMTEVEQVVRASMEGDALAARSVWNASAAAPTGDAFLLFGVTLEQRYGRLQRFAIDTLVFSGAPLSPTVDVSGIFTFETLALPGSATMRVRQSGGLLTLDLGLVRVLIDDQSLGIVELAE
jgi:hypothetical protein